MNRTQGGSSRSHPKYDDWMEMHTLASENQFEKFIQLFKYEIFFSFEWIPCWRREHCECECDRWNSDFIIFFLFHLRGLYLILDWKRIEFKRCQREIHNNLRWIEFYWFRYIRELRSFHRLLCGTSIWIILLLFLCAFFCFRAAVKRRSVEFLKLRTFCLASYEKVKNKNEKTNKNNAIEVDVSAWDSHSNRRNKNKNIDIRPIHANT